MKVIDSWRFTLQSKFMRIFYTANQLQTVAEIELNHWAFIPTMGALHDGHLSLIENAKNQGHNTLVSIFVNPTQFNNSEDLSKYPRTVYEDLIKLKKVGVYAVFIPSVREIYPPDQEKKPIDLGVIAENFEGRFRPGHFEGVVMVLRRLFEIIKPGHVYFGQKDLQQCMVVKNLIESEFVQIQFNMVETKREINGLAMSSRNVRLTNESRQVANQIYVALKQLSSMNLSEVEISAIIEELAKNGIETEYLSYVTLPNLTPVKQRSQANAVIYAGYLQGVRLIDNLVFG